MARGDWQGPLPDLATVDARFDLERMQNLVAVAKVMQKFLQTQAAYVGAHGVTLRPPGEGGGRRGSAGGVVLCRLEPAGGQAGSASSACTYVYHLHRTGNDPLSLTTMLQNGDGSFATSLMPLDGRTTLGAYSGAPPAVDGWRYGLAFRGQTQRWILAIAFGEQPFVGVCPP